MAHAHIATLLHVIKRTLRVFLGLLILDRLTPLSGLSKVGLQAHVDDWGAQTDG